MDIFSQNKLLLRLVIALAILNVMAIGLFIWKELKHQKNEPELFPKIEQYHDVSGILKSELNLTEKQAEQIQQLRLNYFEKEKVLAKTIRDEKDSMNIFMFNKSTNEELVKNLAHEIALNEEQMEILRFQQAKDLKAICTIEQQERFENLVKEIRDYFRPDNQPKRKN
jgi:hypothetical protein